MTKLAATDQKAMDSLYKSHVTARVAAAKLDSGTAADTEVAFKDHETYLDTLGEILDSDDKQSWNPNDMLLD